MGRKGFFYYWSSVWTNFGQKCSARSRRSSGDGLRVARPVRDGVEEDLATRAALEGEAGAVKKEIEIKGIVK